MCAYTTLYVLSKIHVGVRGSCAGLEDRGETCVHDDFLILVSHGK